MFHDSTDTGAVFNRHMCAIGGVTCDWLGGGGEEGRRGSYGSIEATMKILANTKQGKYSV